MPKRKRPRSETVEDVLARSKDELFRLLKAARGFERQRQSKRLHDDKAAPDKLKRLHREALVLKSLDLEQAAYAHLVSSLLRIKAVAEAPELPDEIKKGVTKPEISEEESKALHNVTSSLYNRIEVRGAVNKAISDVCAALGVTAPEKRTKGQPSLPDGKPAQDGASGPPSARKGLKGILSDSLRPPKVPNTTVESDEGGGSEDDSFDDSEAEAALSRFDARLGGWSDEEDSSDGEDKEKEQDTRSDFPEKERLRPSKSTELPSSMFLPSLMGGYISGDSESASDIEEEAPRKNRRGQRARQQTWEKKYKDKAKHLQNGGAASRDAGWDPKRGAVGPSDGKPWKKGARDPLQSKSQRPQQSLPPPVLNRAQRRQHLRTGQTKPYESKEGKPRRETKSTAASHPSWDAARKAKEKQETAKFEGKRIVFD